MSVRIEPLSVVAFAFGGVAAIGVVAWQKLYVPKRKGMTP